jgi:hypothetical protein
LIARENTSVHLAGAVSKTSRAIRDTIAGKASSALSYETSAETVSRWQMGKDL